MNSFLSRGLRQLFSGARRGQSGPAALGAAMALFGFLRSRRGPAKDLVYARNLRDGEAIKVRLLRGDMVVDETEIEG